REVDQPVKLQTGKLRPPVVIIPIDTWNRVTERALRFGLEMSDDITALHVSSEENDNKGLREKWAEKVENPARAAKSAVPRLEIIHSPYRQIYEPILKFVRKREKENPDRLIAVVIPELVEPHWYEYLLHNIHGAGLRALLFLQGDRRTIVITTPWYLRETSRSAGIFRREAGNPACPALTVERNLESADRIVCVTPRAFVIRTGQVIHHSSSVLHHFRHECPPAFEQASLEGQIGLSASPRS